MKTVTIWMVHHDFIIGIEPGRSSFVFNLPVYILLAFSLHIQ